MRTLVHLSDLHFGRVDPALVEPLIAAVHAASPDVVVVSGDLTQRAKTHQFEEARRFLERLPHPQIVVPGNHDVPLWNVFARFLHPLDRFRAQVTDDLSPKYVDDEIAVVGINTARSMVIKNGRINEEQIALIEQVFCGLDERVTKIVVTHHPFDLPARHDGDDLVGRATLAMRSFARCGADVLLAGHFHASATSSTAERYRIAGHAALAIQAGTATSTRGRGEANSFNMLEIDHPRITLHRYRWEPRNNRFVRAATEPFDHVEGEWRLA